MKDEKWRWYKEHLIPVLEELEQVMLKSHNLLLSSAFFNWKKYPKISYYFLAAHFPGCQLFEIL